MLLEMFIQPQYNALHKSLDWLGEVSQWFASSFFLLNNFLFVGPEELF